MSFANKASLVDSLLQFESLHLNTSQKHSFCFQSTNHKKILLITGGGSGHEPAHSGYIGKGMLDGVVIGQIFASPNSSQIINMIKNMYKGTKLEILMIVKNYTGDRLQFGIALEKAKAMGLCDADMLIVQDDVSIPKERVSQLTGRRGLAGTIFVHKVMGAMAESGKVSLQDLKAAGERLLKNLGTIGASFSKCSIPGTKHAGKIQDFDGKVQIGLGIHGEEGNQLDNLGFQTIPFESSKNLAKTIVNMFKTSGYIEKYDSDEPLSVLINNLGSTTTLEMNCFAIDCLESLGPRVKRFAVGQFMTALNMHGISVTVLVGKEWIPYLDAETNAKSWVNMAKGDGKLDFSNFLNDNNDQTQIEQEGNYSTYYDDENPGSAYNVVYRICQMLCQKQPYFDNLDELLGDGDTGSTFARPCSTILKRIRVGHTPKQIIEIVSEAVGAHMQGSSGAFVTLLLDSVMEMNDITAENFVKGLVNGVQRVTKYGGATVGCKTFLDSLVPGLEILSQNIGDYQKAAKSAKGAAEGTASLESRAGRSAYQDSTIGKIDPGAMIFAEMFAVVADEMEEKSSQIGMIVKE